MYTCTFYIITGYENDSILELLFSKQSRSKINAEEGNNKLAILQIVSDKICIILKNTLFVCSFVGGLQIRIIEPSI